jgi:hypothetical protein
MRQQRSTAATVMGILSIVFSSLSLVMCFCVGGWALFVSALSRMNPMGINLLTLRWDMMNQQIPGYAAVEISSYILGLVLAVALLIGGIGLLHLQNWARVLCLIYSVISLLAHLGLLVYFLAFVNPALGRMREEWLRQQQAGRIPGGQAPMRGLDDAVTVLFGGVNIAFAISLLVVLLLPNVSAAFTGRVPRRDDWYDRYDDSWSGNPPPR